MELSGLQNFSNPLFSIFSDLGLVGEKRARLQAYPELRIGRMAVIVIVDILQKSYIIVYQLFKKILLPVMLELSAVIFSYLPVIEKLHNQPTDQALPVATE